MARRSFARVDTVKYEMFLQRLWAVGLLWRKMERCKRFSASAAIIFSANPQITISVMRCGAFATRIASQNNHRYASSGMLNSAPSFSSCSWNILRM